jgi:hypothetical protein
MLIITLALISLLSESPKKKEGKSLISFELFMKYLKGETQRFENTFQSY